jgi:GGDEF domain-containing protein
MEDQGSQAFWKAALNAAKIMSEGNFTATEADFAAMCEEQLQRLAPDGAQISGDAALEQSLKEIARQLLRFFVEISLDAEQESRFNEIMAELLQCRTVDDYDEFKISLNLFLNFFRKTLSELEEDRTQLEAFLMDLSASILTLHNTGKSFLQILDEFRSKLEGLDSTQKMEVIQGHLVALAEHIKGQGADLYGSLVEANHRIARLRQQMEKIRVKGSAAQPRQLLDSRAFRDKFRLVLQNTRLQRDNVTLLLLRLQNLTELEGRIGREMSLRLLKHLIAACCQQLHRNDLVSRLEHETLAILLLNTPLTDARGFGDQLLAAVRKLKFRTQSGVHQVEARGGIACCRMHDTVETITRKAMLALEIGAMNDASITTEDEIPPDLMETIYAIY